MKQFKPGDRVLWRPARARTGYYGKPGAYEPELVEVVSGPDPQGKYIVRKMSRSLAHQTTATVKGQFLEAML